MFNEAQAKYYADVAAELGLFPREDELADQLCEIGKRVNPRLDWQLAPIWARHLVQTFAKVYEHKYPALEFVNGEVIPIISVDPAASEWETYSVDYGGCASFIDDDGHVMAEMPPMRAGRIKGKMRSMGASYRINMFDEERWNYAKSKGNLPGIQMLAALQKSCKRAHDVLTNHLWAFGSGEKGMPGLVNHPNIQVSVAPQNAGATSRLPANKTAEENFRDFVTLIDLVASSTLELHHAANVHLPHSHIRTLRSQFIASTASGMVTVWDRIKEAFKGDDSGQGKVSFKGMLVAEGARRIDPRTVLGNPGLGPLTGSGSDTSGIAGNFMLALPPKDSESLAFVRARPYTTMPPREVDSFNTRYETHSKIGGVKILEPLSVHRLDYGTT